MRAGRRERVVERPMFPSYLFVKCLPQPDHWQLVFVARGISTLLGAQRPMSLPDDAIDAVRLAEAQIARRDAAKRMRGTRERSGITWHFSPGDIVRIMSGPFSGFYARLVFAVDPHDRVRALVNLFGGSATADLSAFHVAAVTA